MITMKEQKLGGGFRITPVVLAAIGHAGQVSHERGECPLVFAQAIFRMFFFGDVGMRGNDPFIRIVAADPRNACPADHIISVPVPIRELQTIRAPVLQ